MIVVVIIGLLAAIAIPAFQRVRQTSRENAIMNNLRIIGGAANQYFLNEGVDLVLASHLVGSGRYIEVVSQVAGESYGVGGGPEGYASTNLNSGSAWTTNGHSTRGTPTAGGLFTGSAASDVHNFFIRERINTFISAVNVAGRDGDAPALAYTY